MNILKLILLATLILPFNTAMAEDGECTTYLKSTGKYDRGTMYVAETLLAPKFIPLNEKAHDAISKAPESGLICFKGYLDAVLKIYFVYEVEIEEEN